MKSLNFNFKLAPSNKPPPTLLKIGCLPNLIVAISNTFLASKGYNIGKSLYEPDLIKTAQKILNNVNVPLPVDVVVSNEISIDAKTQVKDVRDISSQDIILDVGPQTSQIFSDIISKSKTILWNGPLGVFEYSQFSKGTEQLAKNIARSSAYSVAGGGDTIAAIEKFNVEQCISYISTGGGAFLELVEACPLALSFTAHRTILMFCSKA